MKRRIIQFIFFYTIFPLVYGQTLIRFVPNQFLRNKQNNLIGKIEQLGSKFGEKVRIELPNKILNLNLTRSNIKQYNTIITSDGEIPSKVEIYQDYGQNEKYFIATLDKQFYSLYIIDNEHFSSLEKTNDLQATYIENEAIEQNISGKIIDEDINKTKGIPQKNIRNSLVNGCIEIPIAFVCDYAHVQKNLLDKSIAEIEADNLLKLAASQELFGYYAFDAKINFKVIGQMLYDKPDQATWEEDDLEIPLGRLATSISNFLKKPAGWEKQKLLTYIAITGRDYGDTNIWGVGASTLKEFEMGIAVVKGFFTGSKFLWILTHELGHVFGASHDDLNSSIMFPFFYGYGLNWSFKSKTEINKTLNDLNEKKWLRVCPELQLSWDVEKDSLTLFCQTNYEDINDVFTLELSSDNSKTWQKIQEKKSKTSFKYQFRIPQKQEYITGLPLRIRQSGVNEIISNTINIIITATETNSTFTKPTVYIDNIDNRLVIKPLEQSFVEVFDINGRLMTQLELANQENLIDIKEWMRGVYFVKILSNPMIVYKVLKDN
ncbi:T9SS type A sorting domain-containing protein [Emticicia sp. SJ17W-69]|uniref:T9SS type A sorting domain-containing protein n=1 Tax=Emticicia sp. SJ17W-69 TaxID=3421657 RepID=UPI003EB9A38A